MNFFKYWLGKKNSMSSVPKRNGNLIISGDTGEMFVDIDGVRKPIGYSRDDVDFMLTGMSIELPAIEDMCIGKKYTINVKFDKQ